ncbi:MAG: SDR family oxidoreductase [Hyphomicrobiaceae bacterium]|nr:SDR family oxidoreductase [Hyphomicrobiaceae bacterium]
MVRWTTSDIPPQNGKAAVVTGTGGIGYETAIALARAKARVTIAGRNAGKGEAAAERIRKAVPGAEISFELVDLADLASIAEFGKRLRARQKGLDLLVNNAAVMTPPQREQTSYGFELQFGTNHLGHFALTAALLPLLLKGHRARVVSVSSIAARSGTINFADLQSTRSYAPMTAYAQSKLANLMFAFELQRRSVAENWGLTSVAAHPGISRTDLLYNGAGRTSTAGRVRTSLWFLFQPAEQGALPSLFAATSPSAQAGGYYGPDRFWETRGYPGVAVPPEQALDREVAEQLWAVSAQLTGSQFQNNLIAARSN